MRSTTGVLGCRVQRGSSVPTRAMVWRRPGCAWQRWTVFSPTSFEVPVLFSDVHKNNATNRQAPGKRRKPSAQRTRRAKGGRQKRIFFLKGSDNSCTRLIRLRLAIASPPRCTLPGDSFLMRVYWAGLVSSRAFRICSFPRVVRPSGGTTGCSSSARPPAAGKDPDSCSGRLFPPPCNAGMSRSGCPVRATLEELVAGKARVGRGSCS